MAALELITFETKEDNRTNDLPAKYKVVAADMNEIKTKLNAAITRINETLRERIRVNITSASFTGGYYANTNLIGLTPDEDFYVCTNGGSGVFIKNNDGYTFSAELGRITMDPDFYSITIYKPLA